jgi:energy-coupling factor transporter ATP-binding protein EcfA2
MKNIMISGPDGTGKSTIIKALRGFLELDGVEARIVWLRFHHYLAKVVNLVGRVIGKSYRVQYEWGYDSYHNYKGLIGYLYVLAIYIDYWIFALLLKRKKINPNNINLVDRYILDIVADLIVDTNRQNFIFFLFDSVVKKELTKFDAFILKCAQSTVELRREDVKDDAVYSQKINAYRLISDRYKVKVLDTGQNSVEKIIYEITNK